MLSLGCKDLKKEFKSFIWALLKYESTTSNWQNDMEVKPGSGPKKEWMAFCNHMGVFQTCN